MIMVFRKEVDLKTRPIKIAWGEVGAKLAGDFVLIYFQMSQRSSIIEDRLRLFCMGDLFVGWNVFGGKMSR